MALDELQQAERAQRIKQLREESPYTQEALADKLGVTVRAYQAWEEGGGIKWENLENLAEIHGVEVYWIHKGEERPSTPDLFGPTELDELRSAVEVLRGELAAARSELLGEIGRVRKAQEALRRSLRRDRRSEEAKES